MGNTSSPSGILEQKSEKMSAFACTSFVQPLPLAQRCSAVLLKQQCGLRNAILPHSRRFSFPTTMLSNSTVVTELIAGSTVAAGVYFALFRHEHASPNGDVEENDLKTAVKQPHEEKGIIGLTSMSKTNSVVSSSGTKSNPVPQPPKPERNDFESVGANINDYLEDGDSSTEKQRRLEEEFTFASNSLKDLSGCNAMLIIDSASDVVWVDGDLVGETSNLGRISIRVGETGTPEVLEVSGNELFPFLKPEVQNVAVWPIGTQGAVLVVASREADFFGKMEERIIKAVCGRLERFLFIAPSTAT